MEYQYYLNNRQGERVPSIDIIPNISPVEIQELRDFGISNIKQFAESVSVPPHLDHLLKSAQIIYQVLKETRDDSIEETTIEKTIPETQPRQKESPRVMSQADRWLDPIDVERPIVPESIRSEEREASERVRESGRINGGKSVKWVDANWSMSIG